MVAICLDKSPHAFNTLEHFPEKWAPVFGTKCDQPKKRERPSKPERALAG
jgi:hypothetical protein